jgi:hypothetical protein
VGNSSRTPSTRERVLREEGRGGGPRRGGSGAAAPRGRGLWRRAAGPPLPEAKAAPAPAPFATAVPLCRLLELSLERRGDKGARGGSSVKGRAPAEGGPAGATPPLTP